MPEHRVTQQEAQEAFRDLFAPLGGYGLLSSVYANAGVETRYLSFPLDYYFEHSDFQRRNQDFLAAAVDLSCAAIEEALSRAGLSPGQIGHILFVSTTGLATPSIDAYIINRMGFSPHTGRTPIFGLGCSGGVAGLALASRLVSARVPYVLVVATELCSQTLQVDDISKRNLIGTALFGDGAGAAVLAATGPVRVVEHQSMLFAESYGVMGWEFTGDGMKLVMSRDIPRIVADEVQGQVGRFLAVHGLSVGDIAHFVVHPGGRKVLDAYAQALALGDDRFGSSWEFLRAYGNLSSASVLFILHRLLDAERGKPGEYGLMTSLGPGFSCDLMLVRWQ